MQIREDSLSANFDFRAFIVGLTLKNVRVPVELTTLKCISHALWSPLLSTTKDLNNP